MALKVWHHIKRTKNVFIEDLEEYFFFSVSVFSAIILFSFFSATCSTLSSVKLSGLPSEMSTSSKRTCIGQWYNPKGCTFTGHLKNFNLANLRFRLLQFRDRDDEHTV